MKGESPCVAKLCQKDFRMYVVHELRRATRSTLQRVHKCIEVGGGIFEKLL
jgi:uncharacterized protein YerC